MLASARLATVRRSFPAARYVRAALVGPTEVIALNDPSLTLFLCEDDSQGSRFSLCVRETVNGQSTVGELLSFRPLETALRAARECIAGPP